MLDRIGETPGFWLIAALALAGIGADVVILLLSRARLARQKNAQRRATGGDWQAIAALERPSRFPEIIAALLPLAATATSAWAIQNARNLLVTAMGETDPSQKARLASQALSGEMNTTALALWAVPLAVLAGGVTAAVAIGARLRARGLLRAGALAAHADDAAVWLKFPGPDVGVLVGAVAAFLVLAFGPIARSGFAAIAATVMSFAATAGVEREAKGPILSEGLDRAARLLDDGFVTARAGVAIAVAIVAFLAWRFSPQRARARLPGGGGPVPHPGASGLIVAFGVIAVAIAGYLAARPMRLENALPWPAFDDGERLLAQIATPDLAGPDKIERAPVIHVTPDTMGLDGSTMNTGQIAMTLDTLRHNYALLHPHRRFNGQVILLCQANTPIDPISEALRAAVAGGMPTATFAFIQRQEVDRPLTGRRWRNVTRGARTTVIEAREGAAAGTSIIEVARFQTCADLAKAIVEARRARKDVALLLPDLLQQ